MKRMLICLSVVACSGCAGTVVPVVTESLECDPPAAMLQTCDEPVPIKEGITYGEMIDVSRRDRESLMACARRQKSLADTAATCARGIKQYNEKIREISARDAAAKQ